MDLPGYIRAELIIYFQFSKTSLIYLAGNESKYLDSTYKAHNPASINFATGGKGSIKLKFFN